MSTAGHLGWPVGPRWPARATASWLVSRDLGALSRTRALLNGLLRQWQWGPEATGDVVLVASELLTNAAEHGRTDAILEVVIEGDGLVLTVRDGCTRLPELQPIRPTAIRGRGLQMVNVMAEEWGTRTERDARPCGPGSGGRSSGGSPPRRGRPPAIAGDSRSGAGRARCRVVTFGSEGSV